MDASLRKKGPWTHRLLVYVFGGAAGVLFYWLLSFVINDIGTWKGPVYFELQERMLDQEVVREDERLEEETEDVDRRISEKKSQQILLRDSTSSSQTTMTQLLEMQRLSLQKDVTPSPEEQRALAESETLFLSNQSRYQTLNQEIVELSERLRNLREQQRTNDEKRRELEEPVLREYESLRERHDFKVAAVKLAVLTPLLLIAVGLALKKRESLYAPLVYAFGIALVFKVAIVMHDYFPTRYFKYILIVVVLAIVVRILVYLLRMVAFPKRDWLLRQYRVAYEAFLCPVCSYPIRRGPLKYMSWTRRTIKKAVTPGAGTEVDEPYTCPTCGTKLLEECDSCHAIRHSLLPACQKCGAVKPIADLQSL